MLGSGGFGDVYRARRDSDGLIVAVKTVRDADDGIAKERFEREVEALRVIGPPSVPQVHEVGKSRNGVSYIVMELIALPNLGAYLDDVSGPVPMAELFAIADAVLTTLAEVHRLGFLHRDLKPENIFVGGSPVRATLIDFGLVRAVERWREVELTAAEEVLGTAEYMSPEQCHGTRLDSRSDIYSIAVVFYEMLTGRPPFFGGPTEIRSAHRFRRPPRASSVAPVSPRLDDLLHRCLAKAPDERFLDAESLRTAIAFVRASDETPVAPAPAPLPSPGAQPKANAAAPRLMPVLLFRCSQPVAATTLVAESGGELAHVNAGHCGAVFDPAVCEKPAEAALQAAERLTRQSLSERVLIDLAPVLVHARAGGKRKLLSTEFSRPARYPQDSDPRGVLLHARAVGIAPHVELEPVVGRDGLFRPKESEASASSERTHTSFTWGGVAVRAQLMAELSSLIERTRSGSSPILATVLSPPGYGKTFMSRLLALELRSGKSGVRVIDIIGHHPVGGEVDPSARALLARLLGFPHEASQEVCRERVMSRLGPELGAELWPAIALLFGWLSAEAPEIAPLRAAPGLLSAMTMRAVGYALRLEAARSPLVVIVDDAQLVDESTLNAIEFATSAEVSGPLSVLLFARKDFESSRPSWGREAGHHVRRELGPLPREEAETLFRALLEPIEEIPATALDLLFERTLGSPFLMVELVRGLRRDGVIRRSPSGKTFILATDELDRMPQVPLVEWLAEREIRALPEDLAHHAKLAALLGSEFSSLEMVGVFRELELMGAADSFPLDPRAALDRLSEAGVLARHRHGMFTFRHTLIREVVSRAVSEAMRWDVHRAAVTYYRSLLGSERENLPQLAYHAEQCGSRDEAADIYLSLGQQASSLHDYLKGERMFGRALALVPEEAWRRRLMGYKGRGVMRCRLARYEDALADLEAALGCAERLEDVEARIEILLEESTVLDWMNNYERSLEAAERARELLPRAPSILNEARALLGVGRAIWRFNRWSEAVVELEKARRLAETLGDAAYETLAITLMALGYVLPFADRYDEAEAALSELAHLCEARGDKLYLASVLNNRRSVWIARGNGARALEDHQREVEIAREYGNAAYRLAGEYNQGEICYFMGDLSAAWPHVEAAIRVEQRHPEVMPRPVSLLLSARLLSYEGRCEEAAKALAQIKERTADGAAGSSFVANEEVLLEMVQLAIGSDPAPEAWDALFAKSKKHSIEQEEIEVAELRGVQAQRLGRSREAEMHFEYALEVAARIPNIMEPRIRKNLAEVRGG